MENSAAQEQDDSENYSPPTLKEAALEILAQLQGQAKDELENPRTIKSYVEDMCSAFKELNYHSLLSAVTRQKRKLEDEKTHKNQLLTNLEELEICSLILYFAQRGIPLKQYQIINIVRKAKYKNTSWSGAHWFINFLERNANIIHYVKHGLVEQSRVSNNRPEVVENYVQHLQRWMKGCDKDAIIFNADESCCVIKDFSFGMAVTGTKEARPNFIKPELDTLKTILPVLCSDGSVYTYGSVHIQERCRSRQSRQKRGHFVHTGHESHPSCND
jgi:hypothetical protein